MACVARSNLLCSKSYPPIKRLNIAGRRIDCDKSALNLGLLLERNRPSCGRAALSDRTRNKRNVAGLEDLLGTLRIGPRNVRRCQRCFVFGDFYGRVCLRYRENDTFDDVVRSNRKLPVGQRHARQVFCSICQKVSRDATPAVAFVVVSKTLTQRRIGGLLQCHVQRGVDLQSAFLDSRRSIGLLEVLADLLHKVGR